jgi:23S rRNA (cytidine1920-2'-O)/16S rRNA (cytidine1409-2'-O)-methyltransferase
MNHPDITRSQFSDYIKRGFVTVNDKVILKPAFEVTADDVVVFNKAEVFVSRSGEKLMHAVEVFDVNLKGKIVVDVGASTGGFTQTALNYGAKHVFAYDVGTNQMVAGLKNDIRVSSFEQTNILDVQLPLNDLCVVDVSFTSVLPILSHLSSQTNEIILLLKPQFETTKDKLRKGILKSEKEVSLIIEKTTKHIYALGFQVLGFTPSPITGKAGNQEYLIHVQGV